MLKVSQPLVPGPLRESGGGGSGVYADNRGNLAA